MYSFDLVCSFEGKARQIAHAIEACLEQGSSIKEGYVLTPHDEALLKRINSAVEEDSVSQDDEEEKDVVAGSQSSFVEKLGSLVSVLRRC